MGHPGAGDHGPRRGERQVREMIEQQAQQEDLVIATREATLRAILAIPPKARSVVLFAHGAGSSRHSPRNQHVAEKLQEAGLATLLLDLLTEDEERIDMYTGRLRFDIPFLAGRLESATGWILAQEPTSGFDVGYFGASTGAAAALVASVQRPEAVRAIVSRGGRPDLALNVLPEVKPPVLLIVGGQDLEVLEMNRQAAKKLATEHKLVVVPGATHLFEEPGKLDTVADLARAWFARHMRMPAEVHSAGGGRPNHIDAYSYGRMRVSGDDFDEDLIVFPDKVEPYWRRREAHLLTLFDLESVVDYAPEVLIVGTGTAGRLQLDAGAKESLRQKGIDCIDARTDRAWQLFNEEVERDTRVVGAFHLTC
jgi:putative phosphoribosyl transferase